ncbi:fasciclin domain-containing protein [Methanolobus halotolerans]|uniref:Fasciclin n=1 Tax=Methanolobus halotolerans TaxID=2052935 RepID=A0A4E0R1Q9_9EURY|nr:fasciclin domain-containing protein [Methanolobus halotolerans]TGC11119.1 fasciclin [Methanolobus halotolerans]
MAELNNLIDTAKEKGSFPTLLKAAGILGLLDKYRKEGPYTVFAPVESAFDPIPDEVIDESFEDREYLSGIINYHIVKGKYTTEDLRNLDTLETVSGNSLKITASDGIKVDTARIIEADIDCSNGVIHAIDEILVP